MAADPTKRCAVVTGANRGIGYEICRQLAREGITVVLTARDEEKGLEAAEKLKKESGFSDQTLMFHKLNVADPASIASLADFVKTQFWKLDILVNNAGVGGVVADVEVLKAQLARDGRPPNPAEIMTETYELSEECVKINYYGTKWICEAFVPLLQLSNAPKIVNVASGMGQLQNVTNEWARRVLSDAENLNEEKVDQVLEVYLKDFKDGSLQAKSWPPVLSAYVLSKAAVIAWTRILAKKYPSICINAVCPGYVKTDINFHTGVLPVEEGAASPVRLALLPNGSPSGLFYSRNEISSF